jgi:hypothetical protein
MAVKHRFISALPDSPNAGLIRPSNWNDTHDIEPGTIGEVELTDGAISRDKLSDDLVAQQEIVELRLLSKESFLQTHRVPNWDVNGLLTQLDVWSDGTLTQKLFTRIISYVDDLPVTITTTDDTTGVVLTRNIVWSLDGVMISQNEVLT